MADMLFGSMAASFEKVFFNDPQDEKARLGTAWLKSNELNSEIELKDFKILEKEIDDKIRKALNNPLAGVQ